MFKALQNLISATPAAPTLGRAKRVSPARRLMEAAQNRAAHDPRAAQELRSAAIAQLSVVR